MEMEPQSGRFCAVLLLSRGMHSFDYSVTFAVS